MKKLLLTACIAMTLTACASAPREQPVQTPPEEQAKQNRLDVRETVSDLLDYCEKWASAYEANLGKDPVEAFGECVDLTYKNMKDQSKDRLKPEGQDPSGFPFDDK